MEFRAGVAGRVHKTRDPWRLVPLLVLAVLLAGSSVVAARLFVWPSLPPVPAHADAVVVLGGPGDRRSVAMDLVRQGRAPLIAISISDEELAVASWCSKGRLHGVPVICFHPEPFTTRGEGRAVEQLAQQHGWHSVILVTTPDQAKRATLRVSRCFHGSISVATARLPWYRYPGQVVYQAAATVKAYTLETSC
jgi:uncharacterized SAM-binding protein YcdF (DUF218 family)